MATTSSETPKSATGRAGLVFWLYNNFEFEMSISHITYLLLLVSSSVAVVIKTNFFGFDVKTDGNMVVQATWKNQIGSLYVFQSYTDSSVQMLAKSTPLDMPVLKGQRGIVFNLEDKEPIDFEVNVTLPEGTKYILKTSLPASLDPNNQGSPLEFLKCMRNFQNNYVGQPEIPGCRPLCKTYNVAYWTTTAIQCSATGSECQMGCTLASGPTVCGNSLKEKDEECDNGNKPGCVNCKVEVGYECDWGSPSNCVILQKCGDGIRQKKEECDNGRRPGCTNCVQQPGYKCYGLVGGTSACIQLPVCGNSILQQGEQCDNGNKLGCQTYCQIDAGYDCTSQLGKSSSCSICGNRIIEEGEECDNGRETGCKDCKREPGFQCVGTSSFCYRSNPVCGNGIIEIGESCDDSNSENGDGCSPLCLQESGFSCLGILGEASKCAKVQSAVCGNKIYEPPSEQCDNGLQPGCSRCKIEKDWACANVNGEPSTCTPKVVIQKCGDGFWDPEYFEECDDGNTAFGDGCSAFCKIEAGWVCPNHLNCGNVNNPSWIFFQFCGNGDVQTQYGEECDDQNKINGDGCSSTCKLEAGWSCAGKYCQPLPNSFCGDGVTEGKEQCDDGFPLKNGDGCSMQCKVEPGWVCESYIVQAMTRCYRSSYPL